jgi:uncharacterized protein YbjT (DUF2867 family)
MTPGEEYGKTAILLGASGLVGGFCLEALLEDAGYTRIVLLNRRALPIAANPRVTQKAISFDHLSPGDFSGAHDVFSALGTTIRTAGSEEAFRKVDVEYPLTAARIAHQAGARQFVLCSSVGADAWAKNFYLRTKGELEQEIGKLGFDRFHIVRPSLLLGKREESRPGERAMQAVTPLLNVVMLGPLRRFRGIPAATVGRAMVAAAGLSRPGTFIYEYDEIVRLGQEKRGSPNR